MVSPNLAERAAAAFLKKGTSEVSSEECTEIFYTLTEWRVFQAQERARVKAAKQQRTEWDRWAERS